MIIVKLLRHNLPHLLDFPYLPHLEILHQIKGRSLIISHVAVPGLGELGVLDFLGLLDVYEFALLGYAHVVALALLFVIGPAVEDLLETVSHHVISNVLVSLADLVHDSEGGKR